MCGVPDSCCFGLGIVLGSKEEAFAPTIHGFVGGEGDDLLGKEDRHDVPWALGWTLEMLQAIEDGKLDAGAASQKFELHSFIREDNATDKIDEERVEAHVPIFCTTGIATVGKAPLWSTPRQEWAETITPVTWCKNEPPKSTRKVSTNNGGGCGQKPTN